MVVQGSEAAEAEIRRRKKEAPRVSQPPGLRPLSVSEQVVERRKMSRHASWRALGMNCQTAVRWDPGVKRARSQTKKKKLRSPKIVLFTAQSPS